MRILHQGKLPEMGAVVHCLACMTKTLHLEHEMKELFDKVCLWEATCPTCKRKFAVFELQDVSAILAEADAKQSKHYYEK